MGIFRPFPRRTPADAPVFFLILLMPVTLWATPLPQKTVPQVFVLMIGIALYTLAANWVGTLAQFHRWWMGLVGAGLVLAVAAPFYTDWSFGKLGFVPPALYNYFFLLSPQKVHPNIVAGMIVLVMPLALAVLSFGGRPFRWPERFLAALSIVCMTGILILTRSRGAMLAVGAVLVILPLLRWRWGWISLLVGGVVLGAAVYLTGLTHLMEIFSSSGSASTFEGRLEIWSRALYMIRDFPFTGIGMGTYRDVADGLYPFFLNEPGSVPHAHNLFLQVAVDLGIPGLVAWLVILVHAGTRAWRAYAYGVKTRESLLAGLGAGLLCSQLAFIIHGLTDAVQWGANLSAFMVWIMLGLAMAIGNDSLLEKSTS